MVALRAQIDSQGAALAEHVAATRGMVWILLLGGLTVGLTVSVLMSRSISGKLHAAVTAMEEIASGDGDLTRELRLQGRDEMARLASAFNAFLAKIRHTVQEVADTAVRVTSAAEQMAAVTHQTTDGTRRQNLEEIILNAATISDTSGSIAAAAVEQTHSVDEIKRTIGSITGIAEQTSQGSRDLEGSSAELASVAAKLQDLISTFRTH